MSTGFWIPKEERIPAPGEVAGYLSQQGWTRKDFNSSWAAFEKVIDNEAVIVEAPQKNEAIDYPRALSYLVTDLANIEDRHPLVIIKDMLSTSVDIIRLTLDGTNTKDGRIPVETGMRVYESARNLLLAGACAVIEKKAAIPKRKPKDAMDLLDQARFGETELGSFVLSIECEVPPRLQTSLLASEDDDYDDDAPLGRKTSKLLAIALSETIAACKASNLTQTLDPFLDGVKYGVSANLCEAVSNLIQASDAEKLAASFSFASRRSVSSNIPRNIVFSSDLASILSQAAKSMRAQVDYSGVEISGPVVKLESSSVSDGGDIRIYAEVDEQNRMIKASLNGTDYQKALHAHEQDDTVSCTGDITKIGRSWVIENVRNFSVISSQFWTSIRAS
jgi:hypothetical protein